MFGFEIRKANNSDNVFLEFNHNTTPLDEVWKKFRANFEGYETFTVYLEDVILVAIMIPGTVRHNIVAFDTMRGKIAKAVWTTTQLLAVVRVAFCGEEPESNTAEMNSAQEIAQEACEGFDNACRPIP